MSYIKSCFGIGSEKKTCWICWESGNLCKVCKCRNREAHKDCIRNWQFSNIGYEEESQCRFCKSNYKYSWISSHLTPFIEKKLEKVTPQITVECGNTRKNFVLSSKSDGTQLFMSILKRFKDVNLKQNHLTVYFGQKQYLTFSWRSFTSGSLDSIILLSKISQIRSKNLMRIYE